MAKILSLFRIATSSSLSILAIVSARNFSSSIPLKIKKNDFLYILDSRAVITNLQIDEHIVSGSLDRRLQASDCHLTQIMI